jgi:DNA-directed RNA polymerase subunit RPC12/RpoP
MRIELNCAECGKNHFALDGDISNDTNIHCENCGHKLGTMGELKERLAAEVLKRSSARQHAELRRRGSLLDF